MFYIIHDDTQNINMRAYFICIADTRSFGHSLLNYKVLKWANKVENCAPNFLNLSHIILTYHTTLEKVYIKNTLVDPTEMNTCI